MNALALRLLFVVLLLAAIVMGIVTVRHRIASAEARAAAAETTARRLQGELEKAQTHWSSHQRTLNRELLQRIQSAFAKQSQ